MIIDISEFPINSIHIAIGPDGLAIRQVTLIEPDKVQGTNLYCTFAESSSDLRWGYDLEDAANGYYKALTSIIHVPSHLTSVADICNIYPELFL